MAIVKGQWYQWNVHPTQFYRVSTVSAYIQLYPFDTTKYQVMYVSQAYLVANFRLLATSPQYFLIDGETSSTSAVTRAYVVGPPVVWGSVSSHGEVSQSHALLDTTLRAKIWQRFLIPKSRAFISAIQIFANVQSRDSVTGYFTPAPTAAGHVVAHAAIKGSDFTVYPLGGHVNASGRIVQAQANS